MSINVCNNNSLSAITSIPDSISGGALNLISTQTVSSSSTISFTSGLDSTYKEYIFKFIDVHPSADQAQFSFNMSVDTGSNYNVSKTSTYFRGFHSEDDGTTSLAYQTGDDLTTGTGFQVLTGYLGNGNDESCSGTLHLFNPSSTTFVKQFMARANEYIFNNSTRDSFVSGYGNTTSAVDAVQFKMSSGNIDSGTIKLYGVS